MLTALKLYDATNQGLDIILDLVPQASVAVENPKKNAFKYRLDERTPSAYLKPPTDRYPNWGLVDYGISDKPFSPIDLYMREKGLSRHQFTLALHELAEHYGVEDDKIRKEYRPEWNERPKRDDEEEGQRVFESRDTFTDEEIRLWGPNVTEKDLRTYGWLPTLYVGTVRNGRVKECHSTETFPIFVQECHYSDAEGHLYTFHKVYKPREYNKRFRFEYIGHVPQDYIYGLEALRCAWRKNGEKKLKSVFLVSGGSDGANCLSMGGQAVWLNSETADLTQNQHDLLLQYAERIYHIGDVDATGKDCSRRLALQYLDIFSITLPEKLMNQFRDNRGNRRKDLKDYVQLFPRREDFWLLVRQARQAQFWTEEEKTDKEGNTTVTYRLSPTVLCHFLELNGYYTILDDQHSNPQYIQVQGVKVKRVLPKNVRNFLNTWCERNGLPEAVQNLVLRSKDLPNEKVSNLHELNLDFSTGKATTQLVFLRNCWIEVTADGITRHQYKEQTPFETYVWQKSVIDHDYVEHKPMFEVEEREDGTFGARLTEDACSDALNYLRNTSRLHWRQVDEQGVPLTPEQQREEEQCLAAKIACIGYYLHHYRDPSFAVSAMLQDSFLAEDEKEANGRSGKSVLLDFLMKLNNYFFIEARNPDIVKDKFLFDGVTIGTDLIVVDECSRLLQFAFFFGKITGPFRYEEKGGHPITIPADKAPKMIFASNYVIKNIDSSTEARLWPQVFSDYYHKMVLGKNDYREDRGVRDSFGYKLFDADYPEQKWQADIAFAIQCLQFYLSLPESKRKIMPPMGTIQRRTQRANIGPDIEKWATDYYQSGSEHLDVTEDYDRVLADYRKETEDRSTSPKVFTRKLKEFCNYAEHIDCYNPAKFTENKKDGGRIRVRDKNWNRVCKIHVRSVQWVKNHPDTPQAIQQELPF